MIYAVDAIIKSKSANQKVKQCQTPELDSQPHRLNLNRNWQSRMIIILIACEVSGNIRNALTDLGYNAWSCDLLPTETPGNHFQTNVTNILSLGWDMIIAHPPCKYLASSGARWWKHRKAEQKKAIAFFMKLVNSPIPRICIENPIGIMSTEYRKPDQIIQPWQFGHGETKSTCLWLKNLPLLKPTCIVSGRKPRIHMMPGGKNQSRLRSITYKGIAKAMALQWPQKEKTCQTKCI